MPIILKEVTPCEDCPCKNSDCEQGSDCNLGFDMSLSWTESGELGYASNNCELEIIKYSGGKEFIKPLPVMARKA